MADREALLARTFVHLADTLVEDFDIVELLTELTASSVELFGLVTAGLLLVDADGVLRLVAASDHTTDTFALLDTHEHESPMVECFRSGGAVAADDLAASEDRWPELAVRAAGLGWASAHALPMRLRGEVIGVLALVRDVPGALPAEDLAAAQALADVATIGILQQRAVEEHRVLAGQLQHALDSRVAIEQAKGVLAESARLDMVNAFEALRAYARSRNQRLVDVARAVVDRRLPAKAVAAARAR